MHKLVQCGFPSGYTPFTKPMGPRVRNLHILIPIPNARGISQIKCCPRANKLSIMFLHIPVDLLNF